MSNRLSGRLARYAIAGVAMAALAGGTVACGDDDDDSAAPTTVATAGATSASTATTAASATGGSDAAAEAEVRSQLNEELAAEKAGDAEKYLAHVTDKWLKNVVGATAAQVRADPSLFQSQDPVTITSIKVSGNKATVAVNAGGDQGGLLYNNTAVAIKDGASWKLDELHVTSADNVPASARKVPVDLNEYAFGFVRAQMTSEQQIVLQVENKGQEPHMLDLAKIPADANLEQLLQEENPEGVEDLGGAYLFTPGDKADVVIKDKLAPGRYVMLCFISAPDGAPHFAKGMVADFTVK